MLERIGIFRGIYNWVLSKAAHPAAKWWLAFIAGIEAIFFPIPQDIMMVPMMLANRKQAFVIATYALVGSVIGAIIGYMIGWLAFEFIGKPIFAALGKTDVAEVVRESMKDKAWFIILTASITPIPFKVVTILSGVIPVNFFVFVILATLGRALRFYFLATAFYFFGDTLKVFIDRHFVILSILGLCVTVAGFYAIVFLF